LSFDIIILNQDANKRCVHTVGLKAWDVGGSTTLGALALAPLEDGNKNIYSFQNSFSAELPLIKT